jgi:archaemetzincin
VNELCVQAVGEVDEHAMRWAEAALAEWFPFPVRRLPPLPTPEESWDEVRRQHRSVEIMKAVARSAPANAARLVAITEHDLAIPLLTFLFGQAQLDGLIALISLCRLRQEFYGFPPNPELLRERLIKELLHELGHTFGLTHCSRVECSMSLSTHVEAVDQKSAGWCASCGAHLVRRFTSLKGSPYEKYLANPDCR